jgi:hypothetical protein
MTDILAKLLVEIPLKTYKIINIRKRKRCNLLNVEEGSIRMNEISPPFLGESVWKNVN